MTLLNSALIAELPGLQMTGNVPSVVQSTAVNSALNAEAPSPGNVRSAVQKTEVNSVLNVELPNHSNRLKYGIPAVISGQRDFLSDKGKNSI